MPNGKDETCGQAGHHHAIELMTLQLLQDLEKTLEPLLFYFKAARRADEGFGDFCSRVGFPALEAYAASYISPTASDSLPQVGFLLTGLLHLTNGLRLAYPRGLSGSERLSASAATSSASYPPAVPSLFPHRSQAPWT